MKSQTHKIWKETCSARCWRDRRSMGGGGMWTHTTGRLSCVSFWTSEQRVAVRGLFAVADPGFKWPGGGGHKTKPAGGVGALWAPQRGWGQRPEKFWNLSVFKQRNPQFPPLPRQGTKMFSSHCEIAKLTCHVIHVHNIWRYGLVRSGRSRSRSREDTGMYDWDKISKKNWWFFLPCFLSVQVGLPWRARIAWQWKKTQIEGQLNLCQSHSERFL